LGPEAYVLLGRVEEARGNREAAAAHLKQALRADPQCREARQGARDLELEWTSERMRFCLHGHRGGIYKVAFSPGADLLASASEDKDIRLWHPSLVSEQEECVARLRGHTHAVTELCWSADAALLASGSLDHTARVWSVSPAWEKALRLWKQRNGYGDDPSDDSYSDGSDLSESDEFQSDDYAYDDPLADYLKDYPALVEVTEHVKLTGHTGRITALAFAPKGDQLFTGSTDSDVRQWCAATGECLRVLGDHERIVTDIALSPGGARLASASGDETVLLWDTATGECLQRLDWSGQGPINLCRFSPPGFGLSGEAVLVTCHMDLEREVATVCAWDMAGGPGWVDGRLTSPFRTLSGLRGKVSDVDFALLDVDEDGGGGVPSVAVAASGGTVGIIDLEAEMFSMEVGTAHGTYGGLGPRMGFDARVPGRALMPANWALPATQCMFLPSACLSGACLSGGPRGQKGPDGPLLATAGGDGRVRGWHADSGDEAFSLYGGGLGGLGSCSIRTMSGARGGPAQGFGPEPRYWLACSEPAEEDEIECQIPRDLKGPPRDRVSVYMF
jgi:WD40 repeat protein